MQHFRREVMLADSDFPQRVGDAQPIMSFLSEGSNFARVAWADGEAAIEYCVTIFIKVFLQFGALQSSFAAAARWGISVGCHFSFLCQKSEMFQVIHISCKQIFKVQMQDCKSIFYFRWPFSKQSNNFIISSTRSKIRYLNEVSNNYTYQKTTMDHTNI